MKKLKPCPACDGKRLFMVTFQAAWRKKYCIECVCGLGANKAFTKWGALRKWNRAKNRRIIK